MSNIIKHQFFYPNPAEVVWDYLTKSDLLEKWLMKNNFKPVIGYDFNFWTRSMPNFGFDGVIYCKVLELIPYKKLSYSWKGGPGEGKITLDSVVNWTLEPVENGTKLCLEHSGFKEADFFMHSIMNEGWLKNLKEINDFINNKNHVITKS